MSVKVLNKDNFNEEVLSAKGTVLVDFWASWCGPCRMLAPVLEELAKDKPEVKVCKVNIDEEQALAERFGVMSIPTLIVFQGGEAAARTVGVQSKQTILNMLK